MKYRINFFVKCLRIILLPYAVVTSKLYLIPLYDIAHPILVQRIATMGTSGLSKL